MKVFAESVTSSGDDHEQQLRQEVSRLEAVAASDDIRLIRGGIATSTGTIVRACTELRRSHQVVVTQLQDEIRQLHKAVERERSRTEHFASPARGAGRSSTSVLPTAARKRAFCVLSSAQRICGD